MGITPQAHFHLAHDTHSLEIRAWGLGILAGNKRACEGKIGEFSPPRRALLSTRLGEVKREEREPNVKRALAWLLERGGPEARLKSLDTSAGSEQVCEREIGKFSPPRRATLCTRLGEVNSVKDESLKRALAWLLERGGPEARLKSLDTSAGCEQVCEREIGKFSPASGEVKYWRIKNRSGSLLDGSARIVMCQIAT